MNRTKGIILGIISGISYGTNPLFGVPLIKAGMPVDLMLFYRFAIATVIFLPIMLLLKKPLKVTFKEFTALSLLGFSFLMGSLTLFCSYALMPAGIASTILFLFPVFTAVMLVVFFREKLKLSVIAALVLSFAGVALLYHGGDDGPISTLGIGVVMLSALSYAAYLVAVNKSKTLAKMSGMKISFYTLLTASIGFFICNMALGTFALPKDGFETMNIMGLAILPTIISITTIAYAIIYSDSTTAAILGVFEPLTAVFVGVVMLGEPFTLNLAAGILIIIFAVAIVIYFGSDRRAFRRKVFSAKS